MPIFSPIPKRIYERSLLSWVRTSNLKLQAILLGVIVVTVAVRVLPLEMQKKIVNEAIEGRKLDLLVTYCGFYLAAVVAASGLKFAINSLQTYIGQQSLADMRVKLYAHILTLPLGFFRKASPGMIVSSLVTEVATVGDFVGQAVAVPVTNLLTLAAFAVYLFYLNPLLAALSMALYPLALVFVPMLQKRVNAANRERVDAGRAMSTRIGETVSGVHEIHANASFALENHRFADLTDRQFRIRVRWNLWKFAVKNANNFFQSLGPFVLFLVGGWLAINGRLDLGALVAFLSANEKLYDPWKELIDFFQNYQDAKVSYHRVMEYFADDCEFALTPSPARPPLALTGSVAVEDLAVTLPGGATLLSGVDLTLAPGEHLALVGFSGSGKSTLILCLSQLLRYGRGQALLGGHDVAAMTKYDVAANMGYVPQRPFVFDGSIKDNLLYGLEAQAMAQGRPPESAHPDLDQLIEVTQQVGLFLDVLRFGLNTVFRKGKKEHLVKKIIRIRQTYADTRAEELADLVEFFDEARFLDHSSLGANIVFGSPADDAFLPENLPANARFQDFLRDHDLEAPLLDLGRLLAWRTADMLGVAQGSGEDLFDRTPAAPEEIEALTALSLRLTRDPKGLSAADRRTLLTLALRFVPARHTLAALTEDTRRAVLAGRAAFAGWIALHAPGAVSFYRRDAYIHSHTLLDNILFGKLKSDSPADQERINKTIVMLLIEEDMLERIVELGLDFAVGVGGDRLSGGQRQKVALARVFLREPALLLLDEATSALDNASQARVQNHLESKWKGKATAIAVVHRLDTIKGYDRVAVMKAGRIVESGDYETLMAAKGMLYELVTGERQGG